ncbi:MAG: hypothetical protein HKN47_25120 [Pirellulaceae bacterium]|nr:hypothetical protein [Pirellulaceae bacterium]
MEAGTRLRIVLFAVAATISINFGLSNAQAANHRTANFLIQAPSPQLARAVGQAAEKYRNDLAVHWLGKPLPRWPRPCPIRVVAGERLAAQGVTTYNLQPVRDFQMEVVGSPERILDSVLPHEITHTILATHFGRPLPRWADEGICTTVEHQSERSKHEAKLREFLASRRGIAMNQLFLLTEYPSDVLPMYAQGYSVCRFLIDQQGPQTFIQFLQDYMDQRSWTANVRKHYGYESLGELQEYWLAWVAAGSGPTEKFAKAESNTKLVAAATAATNPASRVALATHQQPAGYQRPAGSVTRQPAAKPLRSPTKPAATTQLAHADGTRVGGALQETLSNGWYSRQRQAAQNTLASATALSKPNVIKPIIPPSVGQSGRYSASQPQPEQQMSRAGAPVAEVFDGGPTLRRYR